MQKTKLQLPDIDQVAARTHEKWVDTKKALGQDNHNIDGEEMMLPYDQLSEKAKEHARNRVNNVYEAIHDVHTANLPADQEKQEA